MTMGRVAALCALVALGCSSGYERAYDRETARLQDEANAAAARDQAAHAEASRYAAVVYFATGSADVSADGQRELRWLVEKLAPYPKAELLAQGFADTTGSEGRNRTLSEDRAGAVKSYLVSQGIDAARIAAQGYGTTSPAASNASTKGRRNNRRVEVTVR
jgi:outer membrane protein OmpA-like peptidoglycan-associated protein